MAGGSYIEIGLFDAKTRLSEIMRRVERGERFTITVRGKAVADVVPNESERKRRAQEAVDALLKMPKVEGVPDEMVRAWIEEGRE